MRDVPLDPISIDVGSLVQKSVTSLYSHLVTRPTGRAVRMAIETQLLGAGAHSVSLIDLSEVTILDFSCADEVVAKLLQRYLEGGTHEAFFVFRGVTEPHRDQIQFVLERQQLATVAETERGRFELLGVIDDARAEAWRLLEEKGSLTASEADAALQDPSGPERLNALVERRLAFLEPGGDRYHALSRLVDPLL